VPAAEGPIRLSVRNGPVEEGLGAAAQRRERDGEQHALRQEAGEAGRDGEDDLGQEEYGVSDDEGPLVAEPVGEAPPGNLERNGCGPGDRFDEEETA
jgi:hypothetical protein